MSRIKTLKDILEKMDIKNNPDNLSHNERVIQEYSLKVKDSHGEEFLAIPICFIEDVVKKYRLY